MKTKLITTIIISLLVASSPVCSANPASSLIKIGGKIIKGSSKVAKEAKVIKTSPALPKAATPSAPSGGSSSWLYPGAARATSQAIKNSDKNRNNREEN